VTVAARQVATHLELVGFYDRVQLRQKGVLSGTFLGPEEIERRHPAAVTDLLRGLNGVVIVNGPRGEKCALGYGGGCFMTVMLDGATLRPESRFCSMNSSTLTMNPMTIPPKGPDIEEFITSGDVAAIEVYPRGANMPISLQAADNACGVVAIWTGSRR
jgi:hypothetical protein